MPEDASLDDFLGGSGESDGDDSAEDGPETGEGTADSADAETASSPVVDPVTATYDWSPDGAPCGGCGDVVRARWRDDGDLVCVDCKEW